MADFTQTGGRRVRVAARPFATWKRQWYDERAGFGWLAEPFVFVTQATVATADETFATIIQDWIDQVIAEEQQELGRHGGLAVIHDWRQLKNYTADGRRLFMSRMKSRPDGYLRGAAVVVPDSPFLRMAVQAANVFASVALGASVEMLTDVERALEKFEAQPPSLARPPALATPAAS